MGADVGQKALADGIDWILKWQQAKAAKLESQDAKKQAHRRYQDAVLELSKAYALASASDAATEIRDEVGFFQAVRAALVKTTATGKMSDKARSLAVEQLLNQAVANAEIVDILKAAGLQSPDISVLSDQFLMDVQKMEKKNLALEERTNAKTDFAALEGWCAAVLVKANEVTIAAGAAPDGEASARELAMISREADWPTRVVEYLASIGIVLVFLDHLPGTFLDGAAMRRADGVPVIAMTIRHDRLDNFWFTLLHEYAHVVLHLNSEIPLILDDLDVNSTDGVEAQADEFARNALIPMSIWSRSGSLSLSTSDLEIVAQVAGVHPAIVAGRWRFEHSDYRKFSRLIGRGEVRKRLW